MIYICLQRRSAFLIIIMAVHWISMALDVNDAIGNFPVLTIKNAELQPARNIDRGARRSSLLVWYVNDKNTRSGGERRLQSFKMQSA